MKLIHELKELWFFQTNSFKTLLKIIIGMAKKHRHVFMSRATLALWSGYSIRTVARVLKLLEKLGYVTRQRRPYQSNVYFVRQELLAIDFTDNDQFVFRENVLMNVPVLESINSTNKTSSNKEVKPLEKQPLGIEILPKEFQFAFMKHFDYKNYGNYLKSKSKELLKVAFELTKLKDPYIKGSHEEKAIGLCRVLVSNIKALS